MWKRNYLQNYFSLLIWGLGEFNFWKKTAEIHISNNIILKKRINI